jgi:hypothetical protein
MKRKRTTFVGERPIFTGSPHIVEGGFNLDVENQNYNVGDTIPAGTLAIYDEQTRLVKLLKTAKVKAIDANDAKIVTLVKNDYCQPIFVVGDKVLSTVSGTYADAPSITKIEETDTGYVITLSAAITGLAVDNILVQVINSSDNAAIVGDANALTVTDTEVKEDETGIDVTNDTMQYALLERRVLPIPTSQKDSTGMYLKGNVHIRLSQSY